MQSISTIGLDIAKLVFQVHGVDAAGHVNHAPSVAAPARPDIFPETAAQLYSFLSTELECAASKKPACTSVQK